MITLTGGIDKKAKIIILYSIAYGLLWLGYAKFIIPIYEYLGFEWSPNDVKVTESILAVLCFACILPATIKRPSDFFIHLHFLLPVLPMLVLYGAADYPREYMYFVILAFAVVCWVRKFEIPKIKKDVIPITIMMQGLLFLVALYVLSIILQGGFSYFNLNLLRVYEFRKDAAESLAGICGYLSPIISNIALPFLLILAVSQRKWLIVALSLAASVLMFALTNHKGPLFYPFFVLAVYYILRSNKRLIESMLVGYVLLIILSLLPFFVVANESTEPSLSAILAGSLILRRGFFVPSLLNFIYHDYFSTRQYTMWAESKLSFGLIDYPYDLDASHLIGDYFFSNAETGANTGWLGTGYMHFGFAGMLFYAFLIGLLLSTVDMLAKGRELGISVAILFIPFLTIFLSSDLPTVLLTHGLLLAFLLTWACQLKGQAHTCR